MSRKGPYREPAALSPHKAANEVGRAVITVGTQVSTVTPVQVQLQDVNGNNIGAIGSVEAYLSDDADGSSLTATAPSTSIVIGTDGLLIPQVANKAFRLVSKNNGHIDLNITSTAHNWYLVVVLPTGTIVVSAIIPQA